MEIPDEVPRPLGAYEAVVVRGTSGHVSGQFPIVQGRLLHPGRLGLELDEQQGRAAARAAALNVLGQIRLALPGHWQRVSLARVEVHVACAPGYPRLPAVADGASELFVQVLKERGAHARVLVPVAHLPGNAAIELGVTFHVANGAPGARSGR